MYPSWGKSNFSTSFILDGETFLIFPGYRKGEGYFIHIYNLFTMKKQLSIKGEKNTKINLLSHYPKQNRQRYSQIFNSNKSFVYWGDTSGVLTILGLSKQDKFKEIVKIHTKLGKDILSAVVFEDLYSEIPPCQKNKLNKKGVYAILSFYDENAPLLMYRIDVENSTGEIIKEIANPCKQQCFSMNFYYNEELNKCFIVCGFKGSVKIYDLSSGGQWFPKEFKTEFAYVSSLEIFQKKKIKVKKDSQIFEMIKYYLFAGLWKDKNNLMFCDLSEMKIISTISIPNIEYVFDISIWNNNNDNENNNNKELALVACKNVNSIKLITNFENLKILDFSKDTGSLFQQILERFWLGIKRMEF